MTAQDHEELIRAAWAWFAALVVGQRDVAKDIAATWGPAALLHGMASVSDDLRHEVLDHAEERGCDCGSDAWVARQPLENAEGA